jgi:hypothetical protein
MSALRTKILLRECIKEMLREDDGGMYGGLDPMGGVPYGMHFASQDQMYKIFIEPFANVVGVAAGKTKELSQKVQTLAKVAFETVATTLIPILKDSYGEIFANEKKNIDKIRSEYSDVYNATWDAFKEMDVLIAAFMYRPDLFMTDQFARKVPKAAAKLLSVLSGGSLDNILARIFKGDGRKKKIDHSEGPGMPYESVIREDEKGKKKKKSTGSVDKLAALVKHEKVKDVLANSPKVQQMTKVGQELIRGTLGDVLEQASTVMQAKSLEDLQGKLGKKLPGIDKLQQVPQQERLAAEQQLLSNVKKSMKEFYTKQLEGQVKAAIDAGVPQEHPYVKDYASVISKIKNL